ncbi:MAG TPA: hypothetical protein VFF76_04840 [Holophagaceae bacterium]|jgi:hypothetical protein|nr:hypothetical protein [Holophagaceae bacterium]
MKKLALLTLALSLPALAQAPQFHVALSGQFGDYTGSSEQLAIRARSNSAPYAYNGEPATYDMKSKTPLQLDLGIQNGDDDFVLSYWAGKAKGNGTFTADSANTYYGPYADYLNQLGMSNGNSEIKAHTLDISWIRTFVKNDKGSLAFSLGLREFKVERHMFLDQWDTSTPMQHMGYDQIDATSKGFGLTAGLSGRYTFTERVWLTGGVKLAMTNGKNDFEYQEDYYPSFTTNTATPMLQATLNGQKATSVQMDSEIKLNVNFVMGFDGFVGYRMKSFQNVLGSDSGTVYGYNSVPVFGPTTVGFNGIIVGVGYRF